MIFKRPWQLLLLLIISLIFTVSALARAWTGLKLWAFLDGLADSVSPLYLVSTGVIWGVIGLVAALMIWWGRPAAPLTMILGTVAYSVNLWIEQLFIMVSPLRRVNWPFLIVFNLIVLGFVALTFRQPGVREFYGGRHEQENQQ